MDELNLYFVLFSVHKDKQYSAHAGYVFARDPSAIQAILYREYGETICRSIEKIEYEEGTILYGQRWVQR